MYYRICPARKTGLVTYPEKPLPPKNGLVEYFEASCVNNAHNVTSLTVEADPTKGTCRDASSTPVRCECNLGYFEQDGACIGNCIILYTFYVCYIEKYYP